MSTNNETHQENRIIVSSDQSPVNNLVFRSVQPSVEILKLCANGDIFVKGKLVENDKEVVGALREFLISQQFIKRN
jgi:hypothetical protein